ncbi:exo-alpha-sialidase [Actinocrispum sp. NPDC049592]|uniref:golvesin C-terminal-like domain-containing protein n=1 Tax=Actinocrispum sp. NPDC049592 TaxID=3154835 RepID=UPI0034358B91
MNRSWQRGTPAPLDPAYPINESRVYQRKDGSVVINGRWGAGGTRYRITSTSTDGGQTWSPPVVDGATGQFVAVDAGMVQLGDRLLFSRPDSSARANMTVSISYDEGASYRYSRVVNPGPSYYSDLGVLSDGTVLLVYGRDGTLPSFPERITAARFDLAWLTNGRDSTSSSQELASADARGGTVVSDANAMGGKALRGDNVEVPFDVAAGTYDVAVRLQRRSGSVQVRVSVDGLAQGLIDPKLTVGQGYQVYRVGTLPLTAGRHWLRFTGAVVADQLTLTSGPPADPPNVVADNDSVASFEVVSDTWDRITTGTGYFGQSERVHAGGSGTAKVRFRPDVPMSGIYSAAVWYRAAAGQASNASFVVHHAGGQSAVKVDQRSGGGHWVPLGCALASRNPGGGHIPGGRLVHGTPQPRHQRHIHRRHHSSHRRPTQPRQPMGLTRHLLVVPRHHGRLVRRSQRVRRR